MRSVIHEILVPVRIDVLLGGELCIEVILRKPEGIEQ